jgi:hypothetical protein
MKTKMKKESEEGDAHLMPNRRNSKFMNVSA